MNERLVQLFKKLAVSWNISGPEFKGEDPSCYELQNNILEELKQLDEEDVISILEGLTDEQLEQITSIIEEIIAEFPTTEKTLIEINSERTVEWLNSELKFLGIIEK